MLENVRDWILIQIRKTPKTEKLLAKSQTNLLEKYHFLLSIMSQESARLDAIDPVNLPENYHALLKKILHEQFNAIDSKEWLG